MKKTVQKEQKPSGPVVLDKNDLEILKLLQANARITVKEISEKIHLSTTPVHERIKRLEQNGVIKQYVTLLDYNKVNRGLMVICYVSLKEHSKTAGAKFIKNINELQEVIECYSISGEFDFMLKVLCQDMNAYYDFHVNKLSQQENMGNVQSVFVMGVIKETTQVI
ncbi:MAG: Lrp/AsnC family transcriptional regulator [Gloeobacteraceae cyanobacterium ES-bin-316]|nr:Lrp/AsnC family transcriptional regulator [Ferruginibacter sp.]